MVRRRRHYLLAVLLMWSPFAALAQTGGSKGADPPRRDSILDWNAVALQAVAADYSNTFGVPDQKGPTHTARALAIIHLAMFGAANSITPTAEPYLPTHKPTRET